MLKERHKRGRYVLEARPNTFTCITGQAEAPPVCAVEKYVVLGSLALARRTDSRVCYSVCAGCDSTLHWKRAAAVEHEAISAVNVYSLNFNDRICDCKSPEVYESQ